MGHAENKLHIKLKKNKKYLLSLSSVSRIEEGKHKNCVRGTAVTYQHASALVGRRALSCPTLSEKTCLRKVQCPDLVRSLMKNAKTNLTIICDIGYLLLAPELRLARDRTTNKYNLCLIMSENFLVLPDNQQKLSCSQNF
jgi:hypothetical protein